MFREAFVFFWGYAAAWSALAAAGVSLTLFHVITLSAATVATTATLLLGLDLIGIKSLE